MRHRWIDKNTTGEGADKVDTATCENCGMIKTTTRDQVDENETIHITEWANNGSTVSSIDGFKTPECCS